MTRTTVPELFREQCPRGDPALQALVHERLDDALDWLERLGARAVTRETANPLTIGRRFDPEQLTEALVRAAGDPELRAPLPVTDEPVVLATGGFQGDRALVLEHIRPAGRLPLRANPWSSGDGLNLGRARGAALAAPMEEFYGRAMPAVASIPAERLVGAAQLYGRFARITDLDGEPLQLEPSWSEIDLVQAIAHLRDGRAWFHVERSALEERVRERTVADMVAEAEALGAPVERDAGGVTVQVEAWITHTVGGLAIDTGARVLDDAAAPLPGLLAAGVDAGGIAGGGYFSGLATALVLGLVAAETV
jgi:hypothetical protein